MCISRRVCISLCVSLHVCLRVCVSLSVYASVCVCLRMCVCASLRVCVSLFLSVRLSIFLRVCVLFLHNTTYIRLAPVDITFFRVSYRNDITCGFFACEEIIHEKFVDYHPRKRKPCSVLFSVDPTLHVSGYFMQVVI